MDLTRSPCSRGRGSSPGYRGCSYVQPALKHNTGVKWISRDPRAARNMVHHQGTGGAHACSLLSNIIQEVNGSQSIPVQQGTWLLARVQGVLIRAACSHIIQELNGSQVIPVQQGTWFITRVQGTGGAHMCSQLSNNRLTGVSWSKGLGPSTKDGIHEQHF
jgi:hypothetical protein